MNFFTKFLIIMSITISLFSSETDSNGTCASIPVIELNTTNPCYIFSGTVGDGTYADTDIYKIHMSEDTNLTIDIANKSSTKKLDYSTNSTCSDSPSTTTLSSLNTTTINNENITGDYYIYLTGGSNNAETSYTVSFGVDGACVGGGSTIFDVTAHLANVDIVDGYTYVNPTYTPWITTKVSNKPGYALNAVYLGTGAVTPAPQTYDGGGGGNAAALTILLKMADFSNPATTCETATPIDLFTTIGGNTPVIADILDGSITGTTNSFLMAYAPDSATPLAKKDVRFMYKSIDFNQIIIDSGINCAQKSSDGVVKGIPSCLIANAGESAPIARYIAIFGVDAFNNCYDDNGEPCYSSNGGVGTGQYAHEYGCFECSLGNIPYTCSNDNFAIRPEKFDIDSANTHLPDLLRSGADYNMTIHAYNFNTTTDSQDYNQEKANMTVSESTVLAKDGSNTVLDGTANWGTSDFNISNGVSVYGGANEVVSINFDNVGKVNLEVKDKNWADVDISNSNDPTTLDCTPDGAYICGDKNVTFIPHHFSFFDLNITNNNGKPGTFTYIANINPSDSTTFSMAARIDTRIEAQNKLNAVTTNFRTGSPFYENPIAVTITYNDGIHGDANTTDIPASLLGFGLEPGDSNGTRTFVWDYDDNLSKVLRFNFQRNVNQTINPFDLNGSDLNVTIVSNYSGTAPAGTASIIDDGSAIGTAVGTPTMVYGRTHASRQIYEGSTGTANIYFEVFCSNSIGTTCNKTLINTNISPNMLRTDDSRWFINEIHSVSNDGSPGTVIEKDSLVNVTAGVVNTAPNPNTVDLTYNGSSYPYKTTMQNDASPWLIYNKDDPTATRNQFSVEFVQSGAGWSGEHETNTTTRDVGSAKTNRRSMW